MKKSKFLFIVATPMVVLIIILIAYIAILRDNMDITQIMIAASLTSFGLGVSFMMACIDHIKLEE